MAWDTNRQEGDVLTAQDWNQAVQEIKSKQSRLNVVDALDSTSSVDVLSAKQGKVLDEKIISANSTIENVSTKVNKLPYGIFYGQFDNAESLPDASQLTEKGYAYVASTDPNIFYIYTYEGIGGAWQDSGNKFDAGSLSSVNLLEAKTPTTELSKVQKYQASANINDRGADVIVATGEVRTLGYKVLKAPVDGDATTSFAAQIANQTNTIFEIRDEFDLNNSSVTIPANCTLKFNGGKLINGTINIVKSTISADNVQIFKDVLVMNPTRLSFAWFGAVADSLVDSSAAWESMCATINANNYTIIDIPKGEYNLSNVTQADANITTSCQINGNNSTLIFGSNSLQFTGTATDLTVTENSLDITTFVKESTEIEVEFEETIESEDILYIKDLRNYSGSPSRSYYYISEYVKVKEVDSVNGTITLYQPLINTYPEDANIVIGKVTPISIDLNNINIERTEGETGSDPATIELTYCKDSKVNNVSAVGSNKALISLNCCFDSVVENCYLNYKSNRVVSLNYALVIFSSLNVNVTNCFLKATRHAIAHGCSGTSVYCRYINHSNCVYGTYGSNTSCDVHDGCEYITFNQCTMTGSIDCGGRHVKYIGCRVSNSDRPLGFVLSGIPTTNDILFDNCNFTSETYLTTVGITNTFYTYGAVGGLQFNNCSFVRGLVHAKQNPSDPNELDENDYVYIKLNYDSTTGICWKYENGDTVSYIYTTADAQNKNATPVVNSPVYNIDGAKIGNVTAIGTDQITYDSKVYSKYTTGNVTFDGNTVSDIVFNGCEFNGRVHPRSVGTVDPITIACNSNITFSNNTFKRVGMSIRNCNAIDVISNNVVNLPLDSSRFLYVFASFTGTLNVSSNIFKDVPIIIGESGTNVNMSVLFQNNIIYSNASGAGKITLGTALNKINYSNNTIITDVDVVNTYEANALVLSSNNTIIGSGKIVNSGGQLNIGTYRYNNDVLIPQWWDGYNWCDSEGNYVNVDVSKFRVANTGATKVINVNNTTISDVEYIFKLPEVYKNRGHKIYKISNNIQDYKPANSTSYTSTNYILVRGFLQIKFQSFNRPSTADKVGYCFYDINGDPIASSYALYTFDAPTGTMVSYQYTTLDIPSDAYYFRYTLYKYADPIDVTLIGPTSTSWIYPTNTSSAITLVFAANKYSSQRQVTAIATDNNGEKYRIVGTQEADTAISVDSSTLSFTSTGGTDSITVTTDSTILSILQSSVAWLTLEIDSQNNKKVNVTCVANDTDSERTGTITIVDMDSKVIEVSVTQSAS